MDSQVQDWGLSFSLHTPRQPSSDVMCSDTTKLSPTIPLTSFLGYYRSYPPAQHDTTKLISQNNKVHDVSSLIWCVEPNPSFFKVCLVLAIVYLSHITLMIFCSLSYSRFKILNNQPVPLPTNCNSYPFVSMMTEHKGFGSNPEVSSLSMQCPRW